MAIWPDGDGVIEFPDGRRVRGRGLRHPLPQGPCPDFGIYLRSRLLKGRDPGYFPWAHSIILWRDFRVPTEPADAVKVLRDALDRAVDERVEVACNGGIGRTGTALAVMAVMSGIAPIDAVAWVRARYHRRAVETPWQRRFVSNLSPPPGLSHI